MVSGMGGALLSDEGYFFLTPLWEWCLWLCIKKDFWKKQEPFQTDILLGLGTCVKEIDFSL